MPRSKKTTGRIIKIYFDIKKINIASIINNNYFDVYLLMAYYRNTIIVPCDDIKTDVLVLSENTTNLVERSSVNTYIKKFNK